MLISLNKKIALLAMTKTGSTSLEQVIAPHCDIVFTGNPQAKHMQLRRFERFIRPYLDSIDQTDIETTCLFRDPIDWLGSWFRYRSRKELVGQRNSTANISFDDFVDAYLQDDPPQFASVGRQSEFVKSNSNEMGITHLFKYDSFQSYENFLSARFGVEFEIGRLNVSPVSELHLSSAQAERLRSKLEIDFHIYETLAQ